MAWFHKRPLVLPPAVRKNSDSIAQLEQEFAEQRTNLDRLTDAISNFAGNIEFVLAHAVLFALYILLNTVILGSSAFDPFPFAFLNLALAIETVFLGTFVLMSQNRQSRQDDQRASLDLQIGLLAEQETTKTLQMLQRICEHLGLNEVAKDKELKEMIRTTHVQEVAEELKKAREAEQAAP